MAYNWAQLAFVEKWRRQAVRGVVIGMYRPEDRTYFDLRLHPGEGNVGQLPVPVDLHLIDAGNLIREKRLGLVDRLAVIVRVVAAPSPASAPPAAQPPDRGRSSRKPMSPWWTWVCRWSCNCRRVPTSSSDPESR